MKHILNNLSDEEKNSIREQHTGGMNVVTENFYRLLGSKLGDVKPLVSEQTIASNILSGSSHKAVKAVFDSCRNVPQLSINTNGIVDSIYKGIQGLGTDERLITGALSSIRDLNTFCTAVKNYKTTYGVDLYSDLDGDIDQETVWSQISRILRNLKPTSGTKPTGGVPQKPTAGVRPSGTKPTGGVPQKPTAGVRPTGTKPTGGVPQKPTAGVPQKPTAGVRPTGTKPTRR
jgi:hypothetical protein